MKKRSENSLSANVVADLLEDNISVEKEPNQLILHANTGGNIKPEVVQCLLSILCCALARNDDYAKIIKIVCFDVGRALAGYNQESQVRVKEAVADKLLQIFELDEVTIASAIKRIDEGKEFGGGQRCHPMPDYLVDWQEPADIIINPNDVDIDGLCSRSHETLLRAQYILTVAHKLGALWYHIDAVIRDQSIRTWEEKLLAAVPDATDSQKQKIKITLWRMDRYVHAKDFPPELGLELDLDEETPSAVTDSDDNEYLYCPRIWHPTIEQAITDIADSANVCREMVIGNFLGLCAASIGRKINLVLHEDYSQPANMFVLILASPGMRKSHAMKVVFRDFFRKNKLLRTDYIEERKRYEMAVAKAKVDKEAKEDIPSPPVKKQLICHDFTPESLLELAAVNTNVAVIYDEAKNFVGKADKFSPKGTGSAETLLISGYECDYHDATRKDKDGKSRDISADKVCVSIVGNIQPGVIKETFSDGAGGVGLLERFLFFTTAKNAEYRRSRSTTTETRDLITMITKRLLALELPTVEDQDDPDHIKMFLSQRADKMFDGYCRDLYHAKTRPYMESYMAKTTGKLLRLALIIHYVNALAQDIADNGGGIRPRPEVVGKVVEKLGKDINRQYRYARATIGNYKDVDDMIHKDPCKGMGIDASESDYVYIYQHCRQIYNQYTVSEESMAKAIKLMTEYLTPVAEQIYHQHFAVDFRRLKSGTAPDAQQQKVMAINNFYDKNPEFFIVPHTLQEAVSAGLDLSPWGGTESKNAKTAFGVWAGSFGVKSEKKGGSRLWRLADFFPTNFHSLSEQVKKITEEQKAINNELGRQRISTSDDLFLPKT